MVAMLAPYRTTLLAKAPIGIKCEKAKGTFLLLVAG